LSLLQSDGPNGPFAGGAPRGPGGC
jgi:hypothetical protein